MRIAVNTIFLQKNKLEGYGHYVREIFSIMVEHHPEHEFIFVFDRPFDAEFIFGHNVTPIIVSPPARHPLAFKYWYDVKAAYALRAYKPDVWVQPYGFSSLTTKVPQVLVLHDLAFIHYPTFIHWYHRWYYQLFTKKFLQKAKSIVTVSAFSKNDIAHQYKLVPEKIKVVSGAANQRFTPLTLQEKEGVKECFAGGCEYFVFTGGIHPRKNLLNLLKAFSLFKKWQQSNMKLLVVGRLAWQYADLLEKLKTYKYRDDVVLLGYMSDDQVAKITGAAYAMVYPSFFEGFGLPIIEAMQCGVPVITGNNSSMTEIGGEAALFADPNNPDEIAKQMLYIYKDESLRDRLISAGKTRANQYNWGHAAELFFQIIMKAAQNDQ